MEQTINRRIEQAGAVILAGGDSKRLGRPKALLDFNGKALIEIILEKLSRSFKEITIVTDKPWLYDHLSVRITGDILDDRVKSPLRGIHAGLSASGLPVQFIVACDMPFIQPALINYMAGNLSGYDAVVPRNSEYYQPLHAFYSRSCISVIEEQISRSNYKITEFYSHLKICYISGEEIAVYDPGEWSFFNVNTWADYKKALDHFSAKQNVE